MNRLGQPVHAFDAGVAAVSEIAIETAIYWASSGVTPDMALRALGVSWRSARGPGWYDVQLALSSAWRAMKTLKILRRAA